MHFYREQQLFKDLPVCTPQQWLRTQFTCLCSPTGKKKAVGHMVTCLRASAKNSSCSHIYLFVHSKWKQQLLTDLPVCTFHWNTGYLQNYPFVCLNRKRLFLTSLSPRLCTCFPQKTAAMVFPQKTAAMVFPQKKQQQWCSHRKQQQWWRSRRSLRQHETSGRCPSLPHRLYTCFPQKSAAGGSLKHLAATQIYLLDFTPVSHRNQQLQAAQNIWQPPNKFTS